MVINGVSYPLPNENLYGKRIASALEEAICAAADKQRKQNEVDSATLDKQRKQNEVDSATLDKQCATIQTENDKITRDNEMANLRQIAEFSHVMLKWCDDAQMGFPPQVTSVIRAHAQNVVLEKLQSLDKQGKHAQSSTLIQAPVQPLVGHATGSQSESIISPVLPVVYMQDFTSMIMTMGNTPSSGLLCSIGKKVAAEFRKKYKRQPETTRKMVNGSERNVNVYQQRDESWIRPLVSATIEASAVLVART
jgi:hypothetical protein